MQTATANIVKILKVIDTREYEVIGTTLGADKAVPIPGSGEIAQCARCGRDHEVHVHVELDDGEIVIIGTGCAKKDSMYIQTGIKKAAAVAKRLAKLTAEYEIKKAKAAGYFAIRKNIEETTSFPPVKGPIELHLKSGVTPYTAYQYIMGTSKIIRLEKISISEATAELKEMKLNTAMFERGLYCPRVNHDEYQKKIARAEKTLKDIISND